MIQSEQKIRFIEETRSSYRTLKYDKTLGADAVTS